MTDSYKTVANSAEDELIERRSRFIGRCRPVETEQQALDFINEIRTKHWDASHNVYAYCLRDGQIRRYSDDGEPSGTAGMPVLEVLLKNGITDACIVVTRYFGGVLLGTGGLVRAYSQSAKLAVEASSVINRAVCSVCTLSCSYNQYGKAAALISECSGVSDNSEFTDTVRINFHILPNMLPALSKKLADATSGEAKIEVVSQKFYTL